MKKIVLLAALLVLTQTAVVAQKAKVVNQKDVPERYVRDLERHGVAKTVEWTQVDSLVYDASFVNDNGTRMAYRYSPKGTETRWFVEEKYYPHAILDTVAHNYPKYKVQEIYVLSIKNKTTYQARIAKTKGFFRKKASDPKLLNFETDGKLIDVVDVR